MLFALCFCSNIDPVLPVSVGLRASDMHAMPNSKHVYLANELMTHIFEILCSSWKVIDISLLVYLIQCDSNAWGWRQFLCVRPTKTELVWITSGAFSSNTWTYGIASVCWVCVYANLVSLKHWSVCVFVMSKVRHKFVLWLCVCANFRFLSFSN